MDLRSSDGLPLWWGMGAMQQTVDDECLHMLMCEVKSIMNGRPLTKVSDDPNDLEALTLNHLLLLQPGPSLPPWSF